MNKIRTATTWVLVIIGAILVHRSPKEWPFFALLLGMAIVASLWLMLSVLVEALEKKERKD